MNRKSIVKLIEGLLKAGTSADGIVDSLIAKKLLNVSYGSQEVDLIVDTFKDSFHTTNTSRWDRFSAKRLSEKHGHNTVIVVMRYLADHSGERYCPVVNSVVDVEKKWNSILAFIQRNSGLVETINV